MVVAAYIQSPVTVESGRGRTGWRSDLGIVCEMRGGGFLVLERHTKKHPAEDPKICRGWQDELPVLCVSFFSVYGHVYFITSNIGRCRDSEERANAW